MRSPVGVHLGAKPSDLHQFLHRPEHADVAALAGLFKRPTHEAFLRHAREVVAQHGLDDAVVAGCVASIEDDGNALRVLGDGVDLQARRVLVATGSNIPHVPEWARRLRGRGAPIQHVFEKGASTEHELVGGGISAIQRALLVHRRTGRPVRIWMRRPLRVDEFDFDRDWAKHRFQSTWTTLEAVSYTHLTLPTKA